MKMYKVVSDGKPEGTRVFDPNGDEVSGVLSVDWGIRCGEIGVITLQVHGAVEVSGVAAGTPKTSSTGASERLARAVLAALELQGMVEPDHFRPLLNAVVAVRDAGSSQAAADALADLVERCFINGTSADPSGDVGRALLDYAAERRAPDGTIGEGHPLYARTTCWRDGVQVPYRAVNLATGVSVLDGVETWVDTVRIDDSAGPPARRFLPRPHPAFVHVQGSRSPTDEPS